MPSKLRDPHNARVPSGAVGAPGDPCLGTGGGPLYFFSSLPRLNVGRASGIVREVYIHHGVYIRVGPTTSTHVEATLCGIRRIEAKE